MIKYGYFIAIDNEGEGVIAQVKEVTKAINICKESEKKTKRNCTVAREVIW